MSELTQPIAIEALRTFFRNKPFIFMGTGMSCALDIRFGMSSLTYALQNSIGNHQLTELQQHEWNKVVEAFQRGCDLENALNSVNDQGLLKILTEITGYFIASIDREYSYQIADAKSEWPAIYLIKRIFDTLSDGDCILHVLTPNYDMLFEYACDFAGIAYTTGFWGGVERHSDWVSIGQALSRQERVQHKNLIKCVFRPKKHVRLYKVHGSLNYFFHRGSVIENNAWMWAPPKEAERVMITPGMSKYQTLQRYRQELLQHADSAIDKSTHFLFLGYGFNDSHLEEYINRKLSSQSCHGIIVTKDANSRIKSLLSVSDNLWLVCKTPSPCVGCSTISNKRYRNELILQDADLWDVKTFTTRVLGV